MMKFKLNPIILVSILVISASLVFQACSATQPALSSKEINVTIENKLIRKLSNEENFIGINWMNDGKINRQIFNNPNNIDQLGRTLNALNIDSIRYPNGNEVLKAFWDVPDTEIVKALNKFSDEELKPVFSKTYTAQDRLSFSEFMKFCRKFNIKSTIQVNDHSIFDRKNNEIVMLKTFKGFPKYKKEVWKTGKVNWTLVNKAAKKAASQVQWVKDNHYSDLVSYWEIGNEEFGKLGLSAAYSGFEYAKVASIFIKEMKKVDPSIRIIITNNYAYPVSRLSHRYHWNDLSNEWTREIMQSKEIIELKKDIFAVSSHFYPVSSALKGKAGVVLNDEFFRDFDEESKGRLDLNEVFLNKSGFSNTKIIVNEFNEASYSSKKHLEHTWLGTLLNSRAIINAAKVPSCFHMDYHLLFQHLSFDNLKYNNYGAGIVHFASNFQKPFLLQPTAYTLKLFNDNLKGVILSSSVNNKAISVLPVKNGNSLKIIVLNIRQNKPITLSFDEFTNLEYKENYSLGIGIPEEFSIIDIGDSYSSPSEVRQINLLKDKIAVSKISNTNNKYSIKVPENTLSVFVFNMK